jgi:hypothetical protein
MIRIELPLTLYVNIKRLQVRKKEKWIEFYLDLL